ncbi:LOW QUALITY PROTEIN: calcium-responsive transcription factor-like [Salmo salar]|uniref:LOW QUALITY PROTEIN: calcium-responsive transcription factor-like n=1 Tax=Salmo salar TaxID=8030 RepID=A0ABM3DY90_SALSA|nr:LOW QUALITY PROTEIN: calcium-responsive transcription factor-like [Salmo salar]
MEEQERAMEEDALDSKPPLTTEEDEPKHTDLHGSHITETQQEPSEPEENETKPQSSELLVINSIAPPDSWEPAHTDIEPEQLTETEMLILSQTENRTAIQTQDQTQTLSQTEEFIILDQNGQPIQCERVVILTGQSDNGEMYVIPSNQVLLPRGQLLDIIDLTGSCGGKTADEEELHTITLTAVTDDSGGSTTAVTDDSGGSTSAVTDDSGGSTSAVTDDSGGSTSAVTDGSGGSTSVTSAVTDGSGGSTTAVTDDSSGSTTVTSAAANTSAQSSQDCFASLLKPLPSNAPIWALRLHNAEKIGDSYRGYCNTEAELETILLLHKQQTNSVFGTRQSPSPAKPASRLMWKSQYVPYDGVPFVNAGSRAIVMECQYGPRRKGLQPKKTAEQNVNQNIDYKATCPARIYIKKVCKFPQHRVPTDPNVDKRVVRQEQEKAFFNLRKTLRDVGGVLRYYMQLPTQKAHLYHDMEALLLPPPPDLLFLPMEEEVKQEEEEEVKQEEEEEQDDDDGGIMPSRLNPRVAEKIRELVEQGYHQVYQVRKQLRRFVEREMFKSEEVPERHNLCFFPTVNDIKNHIHEAQKTCQQAGVTADVTQWTEMDPMTETVTLTSRQPLLKVFQRVGVLEGSDTLSPDAVQLFSSLTSLQPKIFAQLQGIQLQPSLCSFDGGPSTVSTDFLDLPSPSSPQPLLVSPTQFLQSSPSLAEPSGVLGMGQVVMVSSLGDGQVVSVSSLGDESGGTHQILLEDGQTIPFQIMVPANIALNSPDEVKEEEDTVNSVD